jgi:hypothetical protein
MTNLDGMRRTTTCAKKSRKSTSPMTSKHSQIFELLFRIKENTEKGFSNDPEVAFDFIQLMPSLFAAQPRQGATARGVGARADGAC